MKQEIDLSVEAIHKATRKKFAELVNRELPDKEIGEQLNMSADIVKNVRCRINNHGLYPLNTPMEDMLKCAGYKLVFNAKGYEWIKK